MSDIVLLNKHQKKALVIELFKQGKTRRQIAEAIHMSFKDIANIINEYTGEDKQINKPEKSNDTRALECHVGAPTSITLSNPLITLTENVSQPMPMTARTTTTIKRRVKKPTNSYFWK